MSNHPSPTGVSDEATLDRVVAAFRADLSERRIYHALMTADLKNAMRAALSTACSPELVALTREAVAYGNLVIQRAGSKEQLFPLHQAAVAYARSIRDDHG